MSGQGFGRAGPGVSRKSESVVAFKGQDIVHSKYWEQPEREARRAAGKSSPAPDSGRRSSTRASEAQADMVLSQRQDRRLSTDRGSERPRNSANGRDVSQRKESERVADPRAAKRQPSDAACRRRSSAKTEEGEGQRARRSSAKTREGEGRRTKRSSTSTSSRNSSHTSASSTRTSSKPGTEGREKSQAGSASIGGRGHARRRVRFGPGTKKHDGLCRSSGLVSTYVAAALAGDTVTTQRLQQDLAPTPLQKVKVSLADIARRCTQDGSATVLPRGGGDASIVQDSDLPLLAQHVQQLKVAVSSAKARAVEARDRTERDGDPSDRLHVARPSVTRALEFARFPHV